MNVFFEAGIVRAEIESRFFSEYGILYNITKLIEDYSRVTRKPLADKSWLVQQDKPAFEPLEDGDLMFEPEAHAIYGCEGNLLSAANYCSPEFAEQVERAISDSHRKDVEEAPFESED